MKMTGDRLRAVVEVKVGPIGARFDSTVVLSDLGAIWRGAVESATHAVKILEVAARP